MALQLGSVKLQLLFDPRIPRLEAVGVYFDITNYIISNCIVIFVFTCQFRYFQDSSIMVILGILGS